MCAIGTVGCAGSPPIVKSDVVGATAAFDGFPPQALEGIVYAQALFDGDYEDTFGTDLVTRGVVPVHVTMQLRGQGQENAQILIKPGRMDARLYLIDGTALPHVTADEVAGALKEKFAREVRQHAFQGGLLGSEPNEGYLFFSLQSEGEFEAQGRAVRHDVDGIQRRLDLTHSLLAFDVMVEDTPKAFYVGIQR